MREFRCTICGQPVDEDDLLDLELFATEVRAAGGARLELMGITHLACLDWDAQRQQLRATQPPKRGRGRPRKTR